MLPLSLLLPCCQMIPDNPEIDDATAVVTLATPGGIRRVIIACPVPGGKPLIMKPNPTKSTK